MRLASLLLVGLLSSATAFAAQVEVKTNLGSFVVDLNEEKAPASTQNFLRYVKDGSYEGTIFHRVIPNFMVQGGGFDTELNQVDTYSPIKNESANGLSNKRATIAMARTQIVDSATRQFYINVVDNPYLDGSQSKPGYAVFGEVVSGMNVIDAIAGKPTTTISSKHMQNVPIEPIIIESVTLLEE
ncbi:peptidylprolyl isomerase [Thaumasiovibrio subtropicus]|uniref:peptidylprolyl isomerase n=1 Tax=Thaumasiovibrio subtropicus TaxID=1891207 RepID=UPI000B35122E|nr:peptidylprolyl isomerase [Thaumasiovibrio subtropicus]